MVVLDDNYIDSQIDLMDSVGFDSVFNSDNYDIMLDFVYRDPEVRKLFFLFLDGHDQEVDPLNHFCKLHLREFIHFVCLRYFSLECVYDFSKKSPYRLQAELVNILDSNNFRYMNELKKYIRSDSDLLDMFCDEDFNTRLKEYLISKRLI